MAASEGGGGFRALGCSLLAGSAAWKGTASFAQSLSTDAKSFIAAVSCCKLILHSLPQTPKALRKDIRGPTRSRDVELAMPAKLSNRAAGDCCAVRRAQDDEARRARRGCGRGSLAAGLCRWSRAEEKIDEHMSKARRTGALPPSNLQLFLENERKKLK